MGRATAISMQVVEIVHDVAWHRKKLIACFFQRLGAEVFFVLVFSLQALLVISHSKRRYATVFIGWAVIWSA